MRKASSYRGARRNQARQDHKLRDWRRSGYFADQANAAAKLNERAAMANGAREAAAKALVKAGVLAQPSVAIAAMLEFYSNTKPPRTRVVNRIIRELGRQMPAVRAA